ncbi:hypothetical protein Glove_25g9 [Diversispora epigaea]|uniref:Uncharacterized protein n=1 Tax=Diversispora epigaea TaxID=1348612 RepID=A0A397JSQ4_9GLOM|nr:hypothetical protein Glove_25g9 [Diversispora epigaea]
MLKEIYVKFLDMCNNGGERSENLEEIKTIHAGLVVHYIIARLTIGSAAIATSLSETNSGTKFRTTFGEMDYLFLMNENGSHLLIHNKFYKNF